MIIGTLQRLDIPPVELADMSGHATRVRCYVRTPVPQGELTLEVDKFEVVFLRPVEPLS